MNYSYLINIKYKKRLFIIVAVLMIIGFIIYIKDIKVLDVYNTYAYYKDSMLVLRVPIDYSDTLNDIAYLKIADHTYKVKEVSSGEVLLDNYINYQEVSFLIDGNLNEGMVYPISIYHNRETIKRKVLKLLFN